MRFRGLESTTLAGLLADHLADLTAVVDRIRSRNRGACRDVAA